MSMRIINKLLKRSRFPKTEHEVKYAFTCGGIDYYQFADFNNTPALRGLKTMVFYSEMQMKCTIDYLQLHVDAVDELLLNNKKGINVFDIKKLNDQLKQRLDIAIDMEIAYKMASVVFFPANELVDDYDFGFNARKVNHWKKHGGNNFFLQQPLQELMPILKSMNENLASYTTVQEKLNQVHLESLLQVLPEHKTTKLKGKSYFSAAVMPVD